MRFPQIGLRLPAWVEEFLPAPDHVFPTAEDRMRLAIGLARENVAHGTGGPFGAAVFARDTGKLIAPGVNLVIPANCSIAHAEIVAITIAQRVLGCYDLGGEGMPPGELVTSTEPCAMCLGAIPWSGIRSVVCGAGDKDARRFGFDEGSKPAAGLRSLEARGIAVVQGILRDEARDILRHYVECGGAVYNGRQGSSL